MVGHNPGTGMLADALCGEGPTDQLRLMATKFPTAGLAIIELRVDRWEEVRVGCGTLREFTRPRDIT
jgi:phosphohistidine phosphatase